MLALFSRPIARAGTSGSGMPPGHSSYTAASTAGARHLLPTIALVLAALALLAPPALATGPSITSLTSPTHPVQTRWYPDNAPRFRWSSAWVLQLTDNASDDGFARASDERVVWQGFDGSDREIYTWTPAGGVEQLTNNARDDVDPEISGDRLVWVGREGDDATTSEIYTWTPAEGVVQLTDNATNDTWAQVSGDRVVWEEAGDGDCEIFTWTPADGIVRLTDNGRSDEDPQVSADRIVWQGFDGNDYEIFTWTPAGGVVRLTINARDDLAPQVSGSRVVWERYVATTFNFEIFTWTPTRGAVRLTLSGEDDVSPQVSGSRVVWQASEGTNEEIYTWTPTHGVVRLTRSGTDDFDPQVSGDRVVWRGSDGDDEEISTWTPDRGVVRLTRNVTDDLDPQVSGDRVVWRGSDGNDFEIHSSTFAAWGYSYLIDRTESTAPDATSEGVASEKSYSRLADGTWFFHVAAAGSVSDWGEAATYRVRIDTRRPTTRAPFASSVLRYRRATLRYRVNDPRPNGGRARVTIRVKSLSGRTVKTLRLGLQPVDSALTCSFRCGLPRRTYRFFVYARDLAGNRQANVAANVLVVR